MRHQDVSPQTYPDFAPVAVIDIFSEIKGTWAESKKEYPRCDAGPIRLMDITDVRVARPRGAESKTRHSLDVW